MDTTATIGLGLIFGREFNINIFYLYYNDIVKQT